MQSLYKGEDMDFDSEDDADEIAEEMMTYVVKNWPALQPAGSTGQYIILDLGENELHIQDAGEQNNMATLSAMRVNLRK